LNTLMVQLSHRAHYLFWEKNTSITIFHWNLFSHDGVLSDNAHGTVSVGIYTLDRKMT